MVYRVSHIKIVPLLRSFQQFPLVDGHLRRAIRTRSLMGYEVHILNRLHEDLVRTTLSLQMLDKMGELPQFNGLALLLYERRISRSVVAPNFVAVVLQGRLASLKQNLV